MDVNRVFICHAIRKEDQHDIQKLHYIMDVLKRAGLEIITDQDDNLAERFFPQLQQKLLTCQTFILLQTPYAVSDSRVLLAVRTARRLAKQKQIQVFRFIYSLQTERTIPQEWKALTTFDGTYDYQLASEKLVSVIAANTTREAVTRGVPSQLNQISFPQTPSQTSHRWSQTRPTQTTLEWLQNSPSQTAGYQTQQQPFSGRRGKIAVLPSLNGSYLSRSVGRLLCTDGGAESSPRTTIGAVRTRRGRARNLPMLSLIALVILLFIGSAGMAFFLTGSKPTSPTPSPASGQVFFTSSDPIGTDYKTGICDEIQVNLNHLTSPKAGKSYYAWLLPDIGHSEENPTVPLGRLTVNHEAVSMTYTDPTHKNLLLTESRFLITEESTSSPPNTPSPDRSTWRYSATIPQTPNPRDPQNYSYLDHIRHLLAKDPTLQQLGLQGGLDTRLYENVKTVHAWAYIAQDAKSSGNLLVIRSNIISILDYLDGISFVSRDVPRGTPIDADPQISRISILSPDTDLANQSPPGYIHHIEAHLQGLTDSPDATDAQRTLASKIDNELNKINGHLEQVRQDAKQLANMSNTQLATSAAASLLTDLVENADSAFMGQLDPTTNRWQGGTTWLHDIMPQFATLNIKEASTGASQ